MAFTEFIIYIAIAFVAGVLTGWFTIMGGSGNQYATRNEVKRVNQILSEMDNYPNATLSLWSEGRLIDSITIGEREKW